MRRRDKLKTRVKYGFSKTLEFSMPMLVGGVITGILLTSCDTRAGEVENVVDIMKSDVDDRTCLVMNLYQESRSESDMANIMVMNTVFNRVKSKHYPDSPCGVVKQKLQYSWTSDGRSDYMHNQNQVKRLTYLVDKYIINKELFLSLSEGADHYHHVNITPEWSLSPRMVKVSLVDNHVFYKRK